MENSNWTVGKVAQRCGVKVSTLHFYEQKGLIRSWRNAGNQRRYKADVLRRVSVIKAAQKMGISLQDIKQAFATLPDQRTPTANDWKKLSSSWQGTQIFQRREIIIWWYAAKILARQVTLWKKFLKVRKCD